MYQCQHFKSQICTLILLARYPAVKVQTSNLIAIAMHTNDNSANINQKTNMHYSYIISRVFNQNNISWLYIIVEIYHSGRKPLISTWMMLSMKMYVICIIHISYRGLPTRMIYLDYIYHCRDISIWSETLDINLNDTKHEDHEYVCLSEAEDFGHSNNYL